MRLLKIGRDASCDIVLNSDKVSGLHAELTLMDSGDILLEDKGSRNGTFVMNKPVSAGKTVNVRRGDMIRFADMELQWSQVPMPEDNSNYKGIYGIGTNFNNDIQLSGSTVSRYHATVKQGRDGKMYIVDHSKNGTTVDGKKISPNNPYRIKRKSAVVCGGVPVDLSRLPWPAEYWKYILGLCAAVAFAIGIWGIIKIIPESKHPYSDPELYAMYNHSICLIIGEYHYEVSAGNLDLDDLGLPTKFVVDDGSIKRANSNNLMTYTGTGFFISQDGQLVTNLHIVKPWLDEKVKENVENLYRLLVASMAEVAPALNAYLSMIKVEGVLDGVGIIPQGEYVHTDNITNCRVLSGGEDLKKDVALIQTVSKRLPTNDCKFVNVKDSIDVSEEALAVGNHMYTMGFPFGLNIQDLESEKGVQLLARGGSITSENTEFRFSFDAASYGGASGSPVFNEYGMLIGVLNSGVQISQGFNYAIKAKYIKELLESPHSK